MTEATKAALVADIEKIIHESGAETVAVAYRDLTTGDEFTIKPDVSLHPASTIKLAVLAELFHQAKQGKLSLDDRLPIKNLFHSSVDGSEFSISADDDSEQTLYKRIGETETLRELARLMEVRSSNFATNLLAERLAPAAVTAYMHEIGADGLLFRNCMYDMKAFNSGKTNLGTARGLLTLLTLLAERKLVSPEASDEMTKILLGQELNDGLPALLPKDVKIAHKTGSITAISHDAGIVYPPAATGHGPYILVVMTRGLQDGKAGRRLIAMISKQVYDTIVLK